MEAAADDRSTYHFSSPAYQQWDRLVVTPGFSAALKADLPELFNPGKQILEIGAGNGRLLKTMESAGMVPPEFNGSYVMTDHTERFLPAKPADYARTAQLSLPNGLEHFSHHSRFDYVLALNALDMHDRDTVMSVFNKLRDHQLTENGRVVVFEDSRADHRLAVSSAWSRGKVVIPFVANGVCGAMEIDRDKFLKFVAGAPVPEKSRQALLQFFKDFNTNMYFVSDFEATLRATPESSRQDPRLVQADVAQKVLLQIVQACRFQTVLHVSLQKFFMSALETAARDSGFETVQITDKNRIVQKDRKNMEGIVPEGANAIVQIGGDYAMRIATNVPAGNIVLLTNPILAEFKLTKLSMPPASK